MLSVPVTDVKQKALNALNNLSMNTKNQEELKVQVLKVLVNLSANPAMAEHLLNSQAPLLLSLFDGCVNKDVLFRVLVFATNLTKSMRHDKGSAVHNRYNEDSIFSTLSDNSLYIQKLASLLHHHDAEVKEQVAKLIMQQC
ncbi:Armadillo repeat-containing X-linked protein 3 [Ophiophagus hannah]|uniref:Armadillo repeat-containing X-linked protein 3 n=1 Tax=Ophiophagus hannah TaxID=8665 RepID=V8N978_OPHHA|nr:Armadillo repeat-containing X-linked protein 3 [Ophiophagus hannah]